jgi:hypothetical protein
VEDMKHLQTNTVNADATPAPGETGISVRDVIARRVSCRAYQPTPLSRAHVIQIWRLLGSPRQPAISSRGGLLWCVILN